MNKRIIDVYYDVVAMTLRDSTGAPIVKNARPYIMYRELPLLRIRLVKDDQNTKFTDFDGTETFSASIDRDWNHQSLPMIKSANDSINVAGDWEGDANPSIAEGQITVRLDAGTSTYKTAVGVIQEVANCTFELQTLEAGTGDLIGTFQFIFRCFNLLDDDRAIPPVPLNNYYTKTQSDARYTLKGASIGYEFVTNASGDKGTSVLNEDGIVLETFWPEGV